MAYIFQVVWQDKLTVEFAAMECSMYVHGFSTSEIAAFLSGEVIDLDELSEY